MSTGVRGRIPTPAVTVNLLPSLRREPAIPRPSLLQACVP